MICKAFPSYAVWLSLAHSSHKSLFTVPNACTLPNATSNMLDSSINTQHEHSVEQDEMSMHCMNPIDVLSLISIHTLNRGTLELIESSDALQDFIFSRQEQLRAIIKFAETHKITTLHGFAAFMSALKDKEKDTPDQMRHFVHRCHNAWSRMMFNSVAVMIDALKSLLSETRSLIEDRTAKMHTEDGQHHQNEIKDYTTDTSRSEDKILDNFLQAIRRNSQKTTLPQNKHHEAIFITLFQMIEHKMSTGALEEASDLMKQLFDFISFADCSPTWWHIAQIPLAQLSYATVDVLACAHILEEIAPEHAPAFICAHAFALLAMLSYYHDVPADWIHKLNKSQYHEKFGELVPFDWIELARPNNAMKFVEKMERLEIGEADEHPTDVTCDQSPALLGLAAMHSFISKRAVHASVQLMDTVLRIRLLQDNACIDPTIFAHFTENYFGSHSDLSADAKQALWTLMLRIGAVDYMNGIEKLRLLCADDVLKSVFPEAAEKHTFNASARSSVLFSCARLFLSANYIERALACLTHAMSLIGGIAMAHAEDILFAIQTQSLLAAVTYAVGEKKRAVEIASQLESISTAFRLRALYREAAQNFREILENTVEGNQSTCEKKWENRWLIGLLYFEEINAETCPAHDVAEKEHDFLNKWPIEKIAHARLYDVWDLLSDCLQSIESVDEEVEMSASPSSVSSCV